MPNKPFVLSSVEGRAAVMLVFHQLRLTPSMWFDGAHPERRVNVHWLKLGKLFFQPLDVPLA